MPEGSFSNAEKHSEKADYSTRGVGKPLLPTIVIKNAIDLPLQFMGGCQIINVTLLCKPALHVKIS